jgi:hypothetical protein
VIKKFDDNAVLKNAELLRDSIVAEYSQAAIEIHNSSGKVHRCVNRGTSDLIEELIADYIANNFITDTGDRIFVNAKLILNGKVRRYDLIWCAKPSEDRTCVVKAVFEIKTDMGRARTSFETLPAKLVSELSELTGRIFYGTTTDSLNDKFHFMKKMPLFLIIVAEPNSGKGWTQKKMASLEIHKPIY